MSHGQKQVIDTGRVSGAGCDLREMVEGDMGWKEQPAWGGEDEWAVGVGLEVTEDSQGGQWLVFSVSSLKIW